MVNNTYLPFKSLPDLMQRFVRPAVFATGHELFELRVFGTAMMASYRGWILLSRPPIRSMQRVALLPRNRSS
jgi:hypothetical protein